MRITNQVLIRLSEVRAQIKELEVEKSILTNAVIMAGGYHSKDFLAIVVDKERRSLLGIREFEKKLGHGWLEENELVQIIQYKQLEINRLSKKKEA